MNENTILDLNDDAMSMTFKMSGGNPGAATVCMKLLEDGGRIDPDAALEGYAKIFELDTLGIYASRIWMLYKDVCSEDVVKMCAVLRAYQLGLITEYNVDHAIDNRGAGIDVDALLAQVKGRLPAFGHMGE